MAVEVTDADTSITSAAGFSDQGLFCLANFSIKGLTCYHQLESWVVEITMITCDGKTSQSAHYVTAYDDFNSE